MTGKTILLFDMDGVLIESHGYHRALQQTIAWMGDALGYRQVQLSDDDIALIESFGISSEWESAAICSALLLADARSHDHDIDLPERLPAPRAAHGRQAPPLRRFFEQLGPLSDSRSALAEIENSLPSLDGYASDADLMREFLQSARSPDSVTHRTIQALVLGPDAYRETYGTAPDLEAESYLATHDRATLDPARQAELRAWLAEDGHAAAVFTNRPSAPPADHLDPPEAQIGAELVGLAQLPIVGSGDLGWLALREDQPLYHFLKPSPVHALAALQRALGAGQEQALLQALRRARQQDDAEAWQPLAGSQVWAFEDSAKGLDSVQAAAENLAELGLPLELNLIGVSPHPDKRRELAKVAGQVHADLDRALQPLLDG